MEPVYFEDARVGMTFKTALSDPFTAEASAAFERLTGDRVHAPRSGKPAIVQGNFIVARTGGLLFDVGHFTKTIHAQTQKDSRFVRPLYVGERIYAIERIVSIEDLESKPYGKVRMERTTYNERGEALVLTMQEYCIRKRTPQSDGA